MHDFVGGQRKHRLYPALHHALVHVTAAFMRNGEVAFPAVYCDGVADHIAVLAWPAGAEAFHVRVACFKVDGNLFGARQVRERGRGKPLAVCWEQGQISHKRKHFSEFLGRMTCSALRARVMPT